MSEASLFLNEQVVPHSVSVRSISTEDCSKFI